MMGIKQIGCGYMYDSVGEDGILWRSGLLSMRLDDDDQELAVVKLSSSEEYIEPVITRSMFTESVSVISASARLDELEHIPEPIASLFSNLYIVASLDGSI